MNQKALKGVLAVLVQLSSLVSAVPSLSLSLSGSKYVETIDDLKLVATLVNTGEDTIRVLNDPQGPLSSMPTETFDITNDSGNSPLFTGIRVKYVPAMAASIGEYTVLTPGQSVEVEHDLSLAYDFSSLRAGLHKIQARDLFYAVDPVNPEEVVPIHADSSPHIIRISGSSVLYSGNATISDNDDGYTATARGPSFRGCSAQQRRLIPTAAARAQWYISSGFRYMRSNRRSTTRYTKWFGRFSSSRYSTVLRTFQNLNGNRLSTYTYDCTCRDRGLYAYVYAGSFGTVYLCPGFWGAPMVGADSMGGILVHEASHFDKNGGTRDYSYGVPKTQALARRSPDRAIHNADSYELFVENTA